MKKEYILLVAALIGLPGCGGKNNSNNSHIRTQEPDTQEPEEFECNESFQKGDMCCVFNEDTKEFENTLASWALDDSARMNTDSCSPEVACADDMDVWEDGPSCDGCDTDSFQTVKFEKDGDVQLSDDQEDVMEHNVAFARKIMKCNEPVMFIVSGDAECEAECFEGERSISEKRAQIVADKLVAAGVPKYLVRVVARDTELEPGRDEVCIDWLQA